MHGDDATPRAVLQAWGLAQPSRRGPKARHTLDDVAAHALALADEQGIGSVTLAALAARLGMTTTGLYRYVDSKEVLDEIVVDAALGSPPVVGPGGRVDRALRWVDHLWQRYLDHRWLCDMPIHRTPRCPNAYAWLDALVAVLGGGEGDDETRGDDGDDGARCVATVVAIDTLTRGYAQQQRIGSRGALDPVLVTEVGSRYPSLTSFGEDPVDPQADLHEMVRRLLLA